MQNFGKIKNVFNSIVAEGISLKNEPNKLLFKKYIKAIKESKILKTQFLVYNNLETKLDDSVTNIDLFVSENIKLLEKFKPSDIISENKKLLALSDKINTRLDESYDESVSKLHESITSLIFTKRTPNNISDVTDNITSITNFIKGNKAKEITEAIELPISLISTLMVDKYNEKYSSLDESERKIIKVLVSSTNEEKIDIYSSVLKECIELINNKLGGADLESKDKLLRVKDKLLNDTKDINEDFIKNISKLNELRHTLK